MLFELSKRHTTLFFNLRTSFCSICGWRRRITISTVARKRSVKSNNRLLRGVIALTPSKEKYSAVIARNRTSTRNPRFSMPTKVRCHCVRFSISVIYSITLVLPSKKHLFRHLNFELVKKHLYTNTYLLFVFALGRNLVFFSRAANRLRVFASLWISTY